MNNISQKTIILFLSVAVAVAGVLAFIPSIVQPPKDLEVENFHKLEMDKNVKKFSDLLSVEHNDTTYEGLLCRFKIYKDEGYLTEREYDELMEYMVEEYLPVFVSQSNQTFRSSVWYSEDHEKMKDRIISLRSLSYLGSSSDVLDGYNMNRLSGILNVIDSYNAAWDLVNNATYTNNINAISSISQAKTYINSYPLNSCTELVESLRNVDDMIAESHYSQLEAALDNLGSFSSKTQAQFKNELTLTLSKISEYVSMSTHYGSAIRSADYLRERATAIEEAANAYYTQDLIRVDTNGEWGLLSQDDTHDTYWSISNHNIHNSTATMSFTISGYSSFTFQIGSRGEEGCDYVIVSKGVVPTTQSCEWSTKDRDNTYKVVTCDYLNPNQSYTFYVVYSKDGSVNRSSDRGYLMLPRTRN